MSFLRPLGYIPTSNPDDGAFLYLNAANGLETRDYLGVIKTYATGVTPEEVQDIIGATLVDGSTVDFTYNDGADTISANVIEDNIREATQLIKGFMSAADKIKLDNILAINAVFKQNDSNNTSNVTLVNLTELNIPMVNGRKYKFRFLLQYRSAAAATGIALALTTDTATGSFSATMAAQTTATTKSFSAITAFNNPLSFSNTPTPNVDYLAEIEGLFQCTTSGNLIAQFRSEVNGSQITVKAGSYREYVEV